MTIERDVGAIHAISIVAIEEYREILVAAPHYICKFEIIEKIRSYLHHLVAMGGAEIHVVV